MKRNHRLRFAFRLCKDLGIDDPIAWFNSVPPRLIDWWAAYEIVVKEEVEEAVSGSGKKLSPEDALNRLNQFYG